MRPQVPIAGGIALFVLGAILRFAVAAGHVGGVDVHVVGIILMFAGVAALLIPLLLRGMTRPAAPERLRRHAAHRNNAPAPYPDIRPMNGMSRHPDPRLRRVVGAGRAWCCTPGLGRCGSPSSAGT